MKRVHKNILGFSGLALVAGMTACAALMPSPEAAAVSAGVTDTLVVEVIEGSPTVDIWSAVGEDATIVEPFYTYNIKYNNANSVKVILNYKQSLEDKEGRNLEILTETSDYSYTNKENIIIDIKNLIFEDGARGGFGYYTLYAYSYGIDGNDYDVLTFRYAGIESGGIEGGNGSGTGGGTGEHDGPVVDSCHGNTDASLDCGGGNTGEGGHENEDGPLLWIPEVASNINLILVKTIDGEVIGRAEGDFTAEQFRNGFFIRLHIDKVGCQDALLVEGYHVVNGNYAGATLIYSEYISMKDYCLQLPNTGAPDTGGLFQDLNISKEDYLITGLIVFFILGVVGFGIVARNHKATSRRR